MANDKFEIWIRMQAVRLGLQAANLFVDAYPDSDFENGFGHLCREVSLEDKLTVHRSIHPAVFHRLVEVPLH